MHAHRTRKRQTSTDAATGTAPTSFRFSDINEATGQPLTRDRFRDLPGWAMDTVLAHVSPQRWNSLVRERRVLEELPHLDGEHRVSGTFTPAGPRQNGWPGAPRETTCGQCRGTGRQPWRSGCGYCRDRGSVLVAPEAVLDALQGVPA
jgi:hypothetical protein